MSCAGPIKSMSRETHVRTHASHPKPHTHAITKARAHSAFCVPGTHARDMSQDDMFGALPSAARSARTLAYRAEAMNSTRAKFLQQLSAMLAPPVTCWYVQLEHVGERSSMTAIVRPELPYNTATPRWYLDITCEDDNAAWVGGVLVNKLTALGYMCVGAVRSFSPAASYMPCVAGSEEDYGASKPWQSGVAWHSRGLRASPPGLPVDHRYHTTFTFAFGTPSDYLSPLAQAPVAATSTTTGTTTTATTKPAQSAL
jgi:hypothetical protein